MSISVSRALFKFRYGKKAVFAALGVLPKGIYNWGSTAGPKHQLRKTRNILVAAFTVGVLGAIPLYATDEKPQDSPLIVFAAASLTSTLDVHGAAWAEVSGRPAPRFVFGGSATMARQIQKGAPADIFISANAYWVDYLSKQNRLIASSGHPIARNTLVLAIPKTALATNPFTPTKEGFALLLGGRRLVLADPALAPAGDYAKSYLIEAGLWPALNDQIALVSNVRQALRLVETAGLPAFIYASDAYQSQKVSVLFRIPNTMAPPILYQASILGKQARGALSFIQFLRSADAKAIWQKFGFQAVVQK